MISLEQVLQEITATKSVPSEDDLRRLPYKKAFVYGRVSSQGQVKESRESIRDVAKLVRLAKSDGYSTGIEPSEVERWLESIQSSAPVSKILEDGDVIVDCRDLGLSGSLGEDKRPGLNRLWQLIEAGEVGCVYLTEGMSRLSRDRDRVLGYKLLKLLKERGCRVRTPEGVFNPGIPRDWEDLAEDVEDSADEMKKMGIRLGKRRVSKAAEGRHVGSPVSPGFVVEIEGQRHDSSYVFSKWQPYPPHQDVVVAVLKELVRHGSYLKAAQALSALGVVFPFFPPELSYMEQRSVLRQCSMNERGYLITPSVIKGLAKNPKLIGIWVWKDIVIRDNHPPIVPVDLFLQAYEMAAARNKGKGRAVYHEPMEWAGVLWCCNHDEPRLLRAHNARNRWACTRGYRMGFEGRCLFIEDHILTQPLTREVLQCLDLTPHAKAVLDRMKSEAIEQDISEAVRRRQEAELKKRIANLERYLGSDDPEQEETYWRLIREARSQLEAVRQRPVGPRVTAVHIEQIEHFLDNLEGNWREYPRSLRNRLLQLLIDRVELRHDPYHIQATIIWKVGLRQTINIERPATNNRKERRWQPEEDKILSMLWSSSPREVVMAALPGRNWSAIAQRASRLRLKRAPERVATQVWQQWTEEDYARLEELYEDGIPVVDIALRLGRTERAVRRRASLIRIARPREFRWPKARAAWEAETIKVMQEAASMIMHHHEWYDGRGYPSGLKGEEIPLSARIISIADAYDTMTTPRLYRDVISHEEALEELTRCSGTQFDAELVEAFCRATTEAKT